MGKFTQDGFQERIRGFHKVSYNWKIMKLTWRF